MATNPWTNNRFTLNALAITSCLFAFSSASCLADDLNSAHVRLFVESYCMDCHQGESAEADLDWESVDIDFLLIVSQQPPEAEDLIAWEKVVKRL